MTTTTQAVPIEALRSIYWSKREPSRPCEACGHPYGLHRGDCPTLALKPPTK